MQDLPPTKKGRRYEIPAIGLREFAGLRRDEQPLRPLELAKFANLLVVSFDEIEPHLSAKTKKQLIGEGKNDWSGGAASETLFDGQKLIILNPTHGQNRQNATLMEEICHVFFGHKPSRLAIESSDPKGKIKTRDYNAEIEEEAYSVGAAALVPFSGLRKFVERGHTSRSIARHYGVSYQLVEYRIKISKLWSAYLDVQGSKRGV